MTARPRAMTCTLALPGARVGALVAVLVAVLAVLLPSTAAVAATDYTEGLRVESSGTYTVDLASGVIHVEEIIHLTNEVPDRVTQSYVEQYYFTDYATLVLPGATNIAASWETGGPLPVSVAPADGALAQIATIDLAPDLYYGGSKTVRLTYDVPGQPPRSGAVAQVNQAFATLPVFTTADPGLGTVTVVLPAGLDVEVAGADLVSSTADGRVTYTATGIGDPDTWLATIIARDDAALVEQMVFFDDIGVHVQAWPGDTQWLEFTSDLVERGLPALKSTIGRPWLAHGQLDVVETSAPYVYGYAGWYEHGQSLIEVGDALDAHVTLHEMAHAWFNGEAFEGRWVNEALADEYAALAMAELGMERPFPEPVTPDAPGAVRLNDWTTPALDEGGAQDQEAYGYAASWWVSRTLVEEIGTEAMSTVVNAAIDGVSPYPAQTDEDRDPQVADWRAFLDHLEGVGGSAGAEAVFRELVVSEADLPLLDARAAARASYAELVEAGGGWAPPAAMRDAMTRWSFDEATAMVPQVREALATVDAVAQRLATIDLEVPTALRADVEGADDLATLDDTLADAAQAADSLVAAVGAEAGANPLARVGLLVLPVADELADARTALDSGAWDRADRAARDASSGVGSATLTGALTLLGVLVAVGLVTIGVVRLRRRPADAPPVPLTPAGIPAPPGTPAPPDPPAAPLAPPADAAAPPPAS